MSKRSSLLGNLIVTGMGRFGGMLIQLLTTIILSRFLTPQDFGIVAMCSIFLTISEMLIDSGMAGSIVFFKDVREIELHTLFWTNFGLSLFLYSVLYIMSPLIADFYDKQILSTIIKVIGVSIVIHAFCIIQNALLTKEFKFRIQSKIMVLSALLSSVIVLVIGYRGYGIWALVAQPILLRVFQVIFYLLYGSYSIRFQYSLHSLKRHWHFGSRLLTTSFMKDFYDNMYVQVIGRVVNLSDAGFYAQAKRFNDMPTNLLMFPLDKVIFPSLAKSENLIGEMDRISKVFALVVIPILFAASLIAQDLIVLFLGMAWRNSGWILSVLLLGTSCATLEVLNRCFLKASGKINVLLKYDLIKRTINILVLLMSTFWMLKGILIAFVVNGLIGWFFNCIALQSAVGYSLRKQVFDVLSFFVLALIPYLLVGLAASYLTLPIVLSLSFKLLAFFVGYFLLLLIFKKVQLMSVFYSLKFIK